jgi:hypothetical protein
MGVLERSSDGEQVPLTHPFAVGRADDAGLICLDHSVAARHAELRWDGVVWVLRDLDSRYGTLVDGQPIRRATRLRSGSTLRFGRDREVWVLVDAGRPGPPKLGPYAPLVLAEVTLGFKLSLDEEQVSWSFARDGDRIDLGERSHTRVIYQLARQRMLDAQRPPRLQGWMEEKALLHELGLRPSSLEDLIWQARRQLSAAGLSETGELVQRTRGRIRLGTGKVELVGRKKRNANA